MPGLEDMGRALLLLGGLIALLGLVLTLGSRIGFLGKLPGDIRVQRENFSCTFPLVTSLLASLVLTVLANVLLRLLRK
ncbi:unnamed protein product [marine sediment metagenome]|uniref:DUF2905 domain-containing protein n=1 Tax=marine sediment metagenome TaxID=412755 RepID=X1L5N2_9ZZZZ